MDKARPILALVLLMAAAFLIGLALSQCGQVMELPLQTDPIQTSVLTESSGPEPTESSTAPSGSAVPPETAAATNPPEPTKSPDGIGVTSPPKPTLPPETTPPPETTAPPETTPPPETTTPPETTVTVETEPDPYDISGYSVGALEYAIGEEINRIRTENGLPPLLMDTRLCAIASVRAYELNQLRGHSRPDGRECESVLSDYGYPFGTAADLLFCGTPDAAAEAVAAAWLANPESQAILLDPGYTALGAAVYESGGMINVALFLVAAETSP